MDLSVWARQWIERDEFSHKASVLARHDPIRADQIAEALGEDEIAEAWLDYVADSENAWNELG